MKIKFLILLLLPLLMGASCKKEQTGKSMIIYGYVKSKTNGVVLPDMTVYVNVFKNGKGMGIINGERTDYGGQGKTNNQGYFEIKIKLFDGAQGLEIGLTDANGNFGSGRYILITIENFERQEVNLEF